MMTEKPAISTLVLAILGLLWQKPMSGYDVRKVFATTAMGHFSDSPGAIYPALKRCQQNGWLHGDVENEESMRPRQVYSLTRTGREALKAHLSQPVSTDDVIRRLGELMLRFAFYDDVLGREPTRRFLTAYHSKVQMVLQGLREQAKSLEKDLTPTSRLALEHGIESYEMEARWARRALEEL